MSHNKKYPWESRYMATLAPDESKICCRCGFEQAAQFFQLDGTRRDGRSPRCKACQTEVKRERRLRKLKSREIAASSWKDPAGQQVG